MVVIGIDAHKRTHTAVMVDANGRQLATRTCGSTSKDHLALLRWASKHDTDRVWALEDCRNMTRRLEQDLLAAGERIVRVPPKLMAHIRDAARTYGKSDPIDALAVARAALREDNLPIAHLDGPDRDVRLLVDHREDLIAERTRAVNRLRWHLHELDADWDPPARSLDRVSNLNRISHRLAGLPGIVARLAAAITERCRQLTIEIDALEAEIKTLTEHLAPTLIAIPGCAALTAAKILGETASILRFHSPAAYARHNGTAPLPVWSSNRTRHRLSRTGNRQLNAALHRIAMTQARCHSPARDLVARRKACGDGGLEALRVLKRRLSDVVYQALRADLVTRQPVAA
ncbi:IS110 family transposase [Micromonospora sp. NPDC005806]|uniref:IS110 family transposase n=1 Tax=Micromonospora sp. NPDC005806 TaxID=3364234 RepID=UPI003689F58C